MTTDRSTASDQKEAPGTDGGLAEPPTNVAEPDYDEGLVHEHGWACGERGAPASLEPAGQVIRLIWRSGRPVELPGSRR